jgi:hypothetical protein
LGTTGAAHDVGCRALWALVGANLQRSDDTAIAR